VRALGQGERRDPDAIRAPPTMRRLSMVDHLREGDTVVWKLHRLSRSLKDVLHIMERIGNAGTGFRSITENIETTTRPGE
jgi:DNA invertase Pin-like site-specific DNA recombinase